MLYYLVIIATIIVLINEFKIISLIKDQIKGEKSNRWKENRWTEQIYGYDKKESKNYTLLTPSKALNQIVISCISIFLIFWTVEVYFPDYYASVLVNFAWSTDILTFLTKPWTIITSGFSHVAGFHLLFNILYYIGFAKVIQIALDDETIWNLHIWGTVAGTILVLIIYNIFPYQHSLGLGASCGIFAVITALAYKLPHYRTKVLLFFVIPVTLNMKQIFYVSIGLSVLMILININAGGGWAHIGGAILGWLWVYWSNKRLDPNKYLRWFTKKVL